MGGSRRGALFQARVSLSRTIRANLPLLFFPPSFIKYRSAMRCIRAVGHDHGQGHGSFAVFEAGWLNVASGSRFHERIDYQSSVGYAEKMRDKAWI